ncbi:hypothetical protein ACJX0J_009789, partial [Zea mays]
LYVAVDDAGFSLVFPFGKFHGGYHVIIFSSSFHYYHSILTKSPNQKQSQLHYSNQYHRDYWPENTLYVAVDDAGFSISSSSLVFFFWKIVGRPRGMTLGTGLLFSFLVSLTKSPNQKQSQLHEFRSKLSILYITLIHLNWHKIILQTKYSITCILTLYRK